MHLDTVHAIVNVAALLDRRQCGLSVTFFMDMLKPMSVTLWNRYLVNLTLTKFAYSAKRTWKTHPKNIFTEFFAEQC